MISCSYCEVEYRVHHGVDQLSRHMLRVHGVDLKEQRATSEVLAYVERRSGGKSRPTIRSVTVHTPDCGYVRMCRRPAYAHRNSPEFQDILTTRQPKICMTCLPDGIRPLDDAEASSPVP